MDIVFEASPLAFGVENDLAKTGISRVCTETLKALEYSLTLNRNTSHRYYIYSGASRWHNILLYDLAQRDLKLKIIRPLIDLCDLPSIALIELHNGFDTSTLKSMVLDQIPSNLLATQPCQDYLSTQDYIFVNSYLATPSVVRLNRNAKVVHHIHDIFPVTRPSLFHQGLDDIWQRKIADFGEEDTYVCVSRSTASDLLRFFPYIPSDAISVIHNSGNHAAGCADTVSISAHSQFEIEKNDYFVSVSTLEPRKDLPLLMEAFTLFKQQTACDHKLVIIGSKGWLGEAESKYLAKFSDRPDIVMLGRLEDNELFALIQTATAYISTARCEGFGLGLAEAMALGCLPIAANNTSQTEVVEGIGFLYTGKEELVDCMQRALVREQKPQDIISASSQRFNWARSSEQWRQLFNDMNSHQ